jgi:hypothetical protein
MASSLARVSSFVSTLLALSTQPCSAAMLLLSGVR